ncbi:4'-phosphopantetheinyl transferase superfamily protein [Geodermatophilus sp. DSM 45219]|uniref:4'-phosphopantetheinyl transferase family protein n=1 Tax=Geodermatophilus sp. DSM 45219 TaxID=1881103 RepID=UPI00115FE8FD|nr:4'-phosphopantetheinyl transferase superfamily protein [Geodermatophilus sp. DSM 45219]
MPRPRVHGRPPWPRSGPDTAPLPGVCQVWWVCPDDVRPEHDRLLGRADLVRRARLACPADRRRLTAAAAVARLVLGAALGTPPAALQIDRTCATCGSPHGRPRLPDEAGLHFSVSHSADCVVVAVLPGCPVGVDVETVGRFAPGEVAALAECALAGPEREHLAGLPEPEQPQAFTGYWVRREAVLKATGQGLGVPPEGLVVSPPSTAPRVLRHDDAGPVWLRDLPAPSGAVAALAGLGTPPDDVVDRDAGPLLRQTSRRLSGPTTRSQRYP